MTATEEIPQETTPATASTTDETAADAAAAVPVAPKAPPAGAPAAAPPAASKPPPVVVKPQGALLPPVAVVAAKPPTPVPAARRPSVVTSTLVPARAAPVPAGKPSKKKKTGASQPPASMTTASASSCEGAPGENTGRWTADEHRLFLQGLEQHGKGWKKIASLIKSRTVVQIRTHAQKYFQKLAKARQNGEEGDVAMEGRGGVPGDLSVGGDAASTGSGGGMVGAHHHHLQHDQHHAQAVANSSKRRRQITGTKRKAIQSVVASAQRQGKKMAAAQAAAGVPNPVPPLPAVAPALAHFVLPQSTASLSSIAAAQGNISGPALEDSLFRFLTPMAIGTSEPQVNDVARQAGANPITLPSSNPSTAPTAGGEISPTSVQDLIIYPSWTGAKDPPAWYTKGADVDALLDVADTLDWLADTGDLNETYQPLGVPDLSRSSDKIRSSHFGSTTVVNNSTSVNTLPHVDSNVDNVVPPLPSLFEGTTTTTNSDDTEEANPLKRDIAANYSTSSNNALDKVMSDADDSSETDLEHLEVFDSPMEEHDFVSTILETKSMDNLQILY